MLPKDIDDAKNEALKALNQNQFGHLELHYRVKLWGLLGNGRALNEKQYVKYKPGHLCRTILQKQCVEKVIPIWERARPGDNTPHKVIKKIDEFIKLGKPESMIDYRHPLLDEIIACAENYTEGDSAGLVAWSASSALQVAISDTDIWEEDDATTIKDLDDDVYGWECDFCASIAYSGGKPLQSEGSIEKRRSFWGWYLDEALSNAYSAAYE